MAGAVCMWAVPAIMHTSLSVCGAPSGSSCRLIATDPSSRVDVRVRISDITLELVAEDAVDDQNSERVWESIDALNPYAGTSLSSARVQAAYDEAEAGYGLGYSTSRRHTHHCAHDVVLCRGCAAQR